MPAEDVELVRAAKTVAKEGVPWAANGWQRFLETVAAPIAFKTPPLTLLYVPAFTFRLMPHLLP